jgi:hypothetical protein
MIDYGFVPRSTEPRAAPPSSSGNEWRRAVGYFCPREYVVLNRLLWGFHAVLTMLRAEENWHRELQAILDTAAAND